MTEKYNYDLLSSKKYSNFAPRNEPFSNSCVCISEKQMKMITFWRPYKSISDEELIKLEPEKVEWYSGLADTYMEIEQYGEYKKMCEQMITLFPDNKIDEDEMAEYLNSVKNYIDNDVITLEIFNSYYKELIRNGTYDRLIEDEVISDEALKTLINSGMLNDDNLKKLKNM